MEKPSGQAQNPQIIKPKKQLGQHWLRQKSVINRIIGAGNLEKGDLVIEIGPGLGNLTRELARKSKQVIAVEKDLNLIPELKNNLRDLKNIKIVVGDALKISFKDFEDYTQYIRRPARYSERNAQYIGRPARYKVIANLPYYAATGIIRKFLESRNKPKLMVLMVQKEVAKRICSQPPDMTLLAVSVQIYAKASVVAYVSRNAFWPKPKVDSAIIRLEPRKAELKFDKTLFFKIVKAGFSQPRKQLVNNLSLGLGLPKKQAGDWLLRNKLKPNARAESLSVENWLALAKIFMLE